MCGILVCMGPGWQRQRLLAARDCMRVRGPDAGGEWFEGEVWLGHRRLRVIDLSDDAAQPMFNEDHSVAVVFNGEIYNFLELRRDLEERGHRFRSGSDTEVIVHGYEEYGHDVVDRLWGMFAFAVWDRAARKLFLARDRYGKKPLSYCRRNGVFAAASTVPALLATGIPGTRIAVDNLAFFWQWDYLPAPCSAYADIEKLPAGHAMEVTSSGSRTWRYYPPPEVAPFDGSYGEAVERFEALFEDATRRRLVSDVPIGLSLSSGLDSSAVATMARKVCPGRLVTLTVRPHVPGSAEDEGGVAARVASVLGTEHHELFCKPDLRESFEGIIRQLGEPFAVPSAIPAFYLFDALRPHATVVLTGDGGDEAFAGYTHYFRLRRYRLLARLVPPPLAGAVLSVLDAVYGRLGFSRPALKAAIAGLRKVHGGRRYDADYEYARVIRPDFVAGWLATEGPSALARDLSALSAEPDPVRREMVAEQFDRMTYHILTKVDLASMASSIEARSPLLDHRLGELARSLPMRFLVDGKRGKQPIRSFLGRHHDADLLRQPKRGFGLPIRDLFAGDLRPYLTEVLVEPHPVYDAMVDRDRIPDLIDRHGRGRPYLSRLLFQLLAFRLWLASSRATL